MRRLRGLYAITPEHPQGPIADLVAEAIAGGASLVQYREKTGDAGRRLREARELLAVCRAAEVPLIVNDDLALAERIGADGVHLGREDTDPTTARARLGPSALIGVSCYDQLERAEAARAAGADYVAFGRFFPSRTKPTAVQADPALLRRAATLALPCVAIGGITPDNAASLIAAGADMLAVVDGVFAQPDVCAAARAFTRLFPPEDRPDEPFP
jgi:thiamine-phosphate pyrophosphorylase